MTHMPTLNILFVCEVLPDGGREQFLSADNSPVGVVQQSNFASLHCAFVGLHQLEVSMHRGITALHSAVVRLQRGILSLHHRDVSQQCRRLSLHFDRVSLLQVKAGLLRVVVSVKGVPQGRYARM